MRIRTSTIVPVTLAAALFFCTGSLAAQESKISPATAPYGVPLAPPIYLINFLFLYAANPDVAANMPAYRAPIPQIVYDCLAEKPRGCPYNPQDFDGAGGGTKSVWPAACREVPKYEHLAPKVFDLPEQINEPLGMSNAQQLAKELGITDDVILTQDEYQCLIGTPPRKKNQEIIFACVNDLSNSNGNAATPLSSYGLSLNKRGDVRSNCAPKAPCLDFNALLAGPLEEIAKQCGFLDKFTRIVTQTPFIRFAARGAACQESSGAACIVETKVKGK